MQQLGEVVARIEAAQPITDFEAQIVRSGGSLGGAKPKALIDVGGEQWVVKFFNGEPVDAPLIEHAAMTLARRAGINVAATRVILETAVGRARAGCDTPRWQGAKRSDALWHREHSQHRQRGVARLDRVRSALTQQVKPLVSKILNVHAV